MDTSGQILGVWTLALWARTWLGEGHTTALVIAAVAGVLALAGAALYWQHRRRSRNGKTAPASDPAGELKARLRRRLAEPPEVFAPTAGPGPTVGAAAIAEGDLNAAIKGALAEAGWRRGAAKHILRRQLTGHAAPPGGLNGSEAAYWRQLGAVALVDNADEALTAYARAAELASDDADLAMLVGVLNLRTGRIETAEAAFRRQLELADGKENAEAVRYRAGTMLGDALLAKGARQEALAAYEAAQKEVSALLEREPDDLRWRRDAAVTHDRIGELRLADGEPEQALVSFRQSLELTEALAKSDPASLALQHDLSVVHDRIGEALDLKGDLDGALESYRRGLELAEAVAERAPERADWRWDVSVSLDRIGDVLAASGKAEKALSAYRRGLKIAETLVASDPTQLEWQRDLAVSCHKVGMLEAQLGREAEARDVLEQGRAIIARLSEIARYQAQWRADLAKFDAALRGLGP